MNINKKLDELKNFYTAVALIVFFYLYLCNFLYN